MIFTQSKITGDLPGDYYFLFCKEYEGVHGYGRYPKHGMGWWNMENVDEYFSNFRLELIF